jgi:hypothetical protein
MANIMVHSNHLTPFILNGNQAGAKKGAAEEALARALRVNHRLGILGLYGNNVEDEGVVSLCNVAMAQPSLKALLLENNCLGGKGVAEVVAAASMVNRRLGGMMELSWNFFSDGGDGFHLMGGDSSYALVFWIIVRLATPIWRY